MSEIDPGRPPILVSAGINKTEARIIDTAQEETISAQTIGGFTDPEWVGNDAKGTKNVEYWDEENQAYYNSVGLKNPGRKLASEYLPRAIKIAQDAGQMIILQVTTLKHEDPEKVLPFMVEWGLEMGADKVEVNGSCPNQDPGHPLMCFDVDYTYVVFGAIRRQVGMDASLGYKVSPLPPATIRRYNTDGRLGVDFVTTINTKGNQLSPINPITSKPYIEVKDGLAGQSGPIIHNLAIENLRMWGGDYDLNGEVVEKSPFDLYSVGGLLGGTDGFMRVNELQAKMFGGAQEFRRAADPRRVAQRWAQEYVEANPDI
jgi:dihydroorotate dehydrogenase